MQKNSRKPAKVQQPTSGDSAQAPSAANQKLMTAVIDGDLDAINDAIGQGANPNWKNKYGKSAMIHAAINGYPEVAMKVIAAGGDVNTKDKNGRSLSQIAAAEGTPETKAVIDLARLESANGVNELLAEGEDPNALMLLAIKGGSQYQSTVRVLLENGADVDVALRLAASRGDVGAMKLLVAEGDAEPNDVDENGNSALTCAIKHEQADAVKVLLAMDVSVDEADLCAIGDPDRGLHRNRSAAMQAIVRQLMMKAAQTDNHLLLSQLVGRYANVNASVDGKQHQSTPLMAAAARGYVNIVRYLLDRPRHKIREDDTPYTEALIHQMTPDVGRRNKKGWSAFMFALHNGHVDVVKLFTDRELGRPSKKAERVRACFTKCMRDDPTFGKRMADQLAASNNPEQIMRVIYAAIDAKGRQHGAEDERFKVMKGAFDGIEDESDKARCKTILGMMPTLHEHDEDEGLGIGQALGLSSGKRTSEAIHHLGAPIPTVVKGEGGFFSWRRLFGSQDSKK